MRVGLARDLSPELISAQFQSGALPRVVWLVQSNKGVRWGGSRHFREEAAALESGNGGSFLFCTGLTETAVSTVRGLPRSIGLRADFLVPTSA